MAVAAELYEYVVELGKALSELLSCYPSASELYENLNYAYSGFCRFVLDVSLFTERQA